VSFNDALELIMVLPGKMAKEMRTKFADIIKRYLAGDASLIKEAQANAASSHPIAQMARASLAADNGISAKDRALESRKRKIELDIMDSQACFENERRKLQIKNEKLELDTKESQARFEDKRRRLQIKNERLDLIKSLSPNGAIDDQVRMAFKDSI
jgi:hypothetical protein